MSGSLDLEGPSSIDLLRFFNARAPEVRALVGESPSVAVARHMRRRATSHSSRKWPLQQRLQQQERNRGKDAKDTEDNDRESPLLSRRARRRPGRSSMTAPTVAGYEPTRKMRRAAVRRPRYVVSPWRSLISSLVSTLASRDL